jgi:hypothetical protein
MQSSAPHWLSSSTPHCSLRRPTHVVIDKSDSSSSSVVAAVVDSVSCSLHAVVCCRASLCVVVCRPLGWVLGRLCCRHDRCSCVVVSCPSRLCRGWGRGCCCLHLSRHFVVLVGPGVVVVIESAWHVVVVVSESSRCASRQCVMCMQLLVREGDRAGECTRQALDHSTDNCNATSQEIARDRNAHYDFLAACDADYDFPRDDRQRRRSLQPQLRFHPPPRRKLQP